MTTETFPFFVRLPTADKTIPLLDAEFRYTTKAVRQLERAAGTSILLLLSSGRTVEALVLLVCYGLKWKSLKAHGLKRLGADGKPLAEMTEDVAVDLIDEFIDAGGNTGDLSNALYKALNTSGVYGRAETE